MYIPGEDSGTHPVSRSDDFKNSGQYFNRSTTSAGAMRGDAYLNLRASSSSSVSPVKNVFKEYDQKQQRCPRLTQSEVDMETVDILPKLNFDVS